MRLREKYLLYGIGGLLTFSSASGGVYSKDEVKLNEMRT